MPSGTQTSFFNRHNPRGHSSSTSTSTSKASSQESKNSIEPVTPKPQLMPTEIFNNMSLEIAKEIHEEFLICKICLDSFHIPKSLSCLHTFCQHCIESHISAEVTYNKVTDYHHFTCPLCRKRTTLPIGGVKKLPDNFFVSGLADMLARAPRVSSVAPTVAVAVKETEGDDSVSDMVGRRRIGQVGITGQGECEICGQFGDDIGRGRSSTPRMGRKESDDSGISAHRATSATFFNVPLAESKCLDCNKLLCESCVRRHKAIKVTRDHAIFDLATESSIACPLHPDEPVRFFCKLCSTCVCILCTFDDHRDHEMITFAEAVLNLREELKKHVQETEISVQKSKKWLDILVETGNFVHKMETDIKETVDRAIDELHNQEDALIEQLHAKVGRVTLQTIERVPEWETQVIHLEAVKSEVKDLLEGQDINVLLTNSNIKEKLMKLGQLEVTGCLPSAICPKFTFFPNKISLGYIDFATPVTKGNIADAPLPPARPIKPEPTLNGNLLSVSSTQTDDVAFVSGAVSKPEMKEIGSETETKSPQPPAKHVRHRAINTEKGTAVDQETNTRPRGVNVSLTFGGDEMVQDVVDNYLTAIADIENSGQEEAFAAMDNLTRARMRRKLKERWSTVDASDIAEVSPTSPQTPTYRRFSGALPRY